MAIITLPSITAAGASMRLARGDQALETLSGAAYVVQSTLALWTLSFPLNTKRIDDARAWQAALVQLSKLGNQFEITPPGWVNGVGWTGNNPVVDGGSQLGLSLNIYLAGVNNTAIALVGDYIEITSTGEMKMLTTNLTTGPTGFATAYFEPAMRNSPTSATSVDIKTPKCTMRLLSPTATWAQQIPNYYNMTIDAVEHF